MAKHNPLNYAICPGCGEVYSKQGMDANRKMDAHRGWFCCANCQYEICDPPYRLLTIGEMVSSVGAGVKDYRDVDLVRYTQRVVALLDRGRDD